jgi:hypothetical protein
MIYCTVGIFLLFVSAELLGIFQMHTLGIRFIEIQHLMQFYASFVKKNKKIKEKVYETFGWKIVKLLCIIGTVVLSFTNYHHFCTGTGMFWRSVKIMNL